MKRRCKYFILTPMVILSMAWMGESAAVAQTTPPLQQTPIKLQASRVLSNDLLRGDNYTVNESVANDGLFNIYELDTKYGEFKVETTALLLTRINELRALKVLEEISASKEFAKAAGEGLAAPVKGAGKMVTAPVETTKGIAKGTGRFLSNVGRSITSNDPHQANVVGAALGYDATKRAYAYELGIDPNTKYEPLGNRLGTVAKSSVAGGLGVSVGMGAATSGTTFGTILEISSTAEGMRQLAADKPPGALQKINQKKLEALGAKKDLIKAYLSNYEYTPQEMTMFVGDLDTMKGVKDLDALVSIATLANDQSLALYYRLTAQLLAGYHKNVAPAVRIVDLFGEPALQTRDGKIVIPGAVDYMIWSKAVADVLDGLEQDMTKISDVSGKEVWISGKMDGTAREAFEAKGWKVTENANDKLVKR